MGILKGILNLFRGVSSNQIKLERMLTVLQIRTDPPDWAELGFEIGINTVREFFNRDARIYTKEECVDLLLAFLSRQSALYRESGAVFTVSYVRKWPLWEHEDSTQHRVRGRVDISYDNSGETRLLLILGGMVRVLVIRVSEDGYKGCIYCHVSYDDNFSVDDLDKQD